MMACLTTENKLFVIKGRYEPELPWQYVLKGCFWSQRLRDASAYTESHAKNIAHAFKRLHEEGRYVPTEIEIVPTDELEE